MKAIVILSLCFIAGLGGGYVTLVIADQRMQEKEVASPVRKAVIWIRQGERVAANRGVDFLEASSQLRHVIGRILKEDTSLNLEETLEYILSTKDNSEKKQAALVLLFSHWANVDLEGALKKAKSLDNPYVHLIKREIFTVMIIKDPKGAAVYYKNNQEALYAHKYYFLPELARKWAMQAPDDAWEWMVSLDGRGQSDVIDSFFSGLGNSSGVIETYLNKVMADAGFRDNVSVSGVLKNWSKFDFANAMGWINSLDEKSRNDFLGKVIIGGAENNFNLATSYLSEVPVNLMPGVLASVAEVVQRKKGSKEAMDWMVGQMPEGTRFPDFSILSDWSARDSESAKSWLQQFSPQDKRIKDFALEAYVTSSRDRNYEETLEMAQHISIPRLRKSAFLSAFMHWDINDPVAARKWAEDFKGDEDVKNEMKKIIK